METKDEEDYAESGDQRVLVCGLQAERTGGSSHVFCCCCSSFDVRDHVQCATIEPKAEATIEVVSSQVASR